MSRSPFLQTLSHRLGIGLLVAHTTGNTMLHISKPLAREEDNDSEPDCLGWRVTYEGQ